MQIICEEERQRDEERLGRGGKNEMLMWKYNETDEGETEGRRGRREEIQGDEERRYSDDLRGFCLHGCDVTRQQSMF